MGREIVNMATILVVDDDRDIVDAIRTVLEKEGHAVITAGGTIEAKKALKEHTPALLITDVMMDSADDGLVLVQELRRGGNHIPTLMLTGLPQATRMRFFKDSLMIPVDEFVEKPVAPGRLLEMVSRLLHESR